MTKKEKHKESREGPKSTLKEVLATDSLFVKYKELMTQSGLDIEKSMKELEEVHKNRYFRDLTAPSPKKLGKALLKDQQDRSTIVGYLIAAKKEFDPCKRAHKALSDHIVSKYKNYLTGRTQADRNAALRRALALGERRIASLDQFMEFCVTIIADIDSARFALQSTGTLTKITNQSEHY